MGNTITVRRDSCMSVPVGLFLSSMLSIAILANGCDESPDVVARNLRSLIEKSAPVGSSRSDVVRLLQSQGIKEGGPPQRVSEARHQGTFYVVDPRTKKVTAILRNVGKAVLARTDIYVTFVFDDNDTLMSYTVEE